MRIIDKNTDFYDYLQNIYYDTSITFDRRDSFIVTKDLIKEEISPWIRRYDKDTKFYLLLQVCNTFWIFSTDLNLEISRWGNVVRIKDYSLFLEDTWKDYDKERELIKLDIINFPFYIRKINSAIMMDCIQQNNYKIRSTINKYTIYKDDGNNDEKHIPLLKACGIGPLIDPLEIYNSIEEYFNLEKQSIERTESIGLTNNEKIENHGFDTKISFRGKQ